MLEINKEKFKTGSEMPKFSACGGLFYRKCSLLFDFGYKNAARRAAKIFRGQNPIYGQNQNNNTVGHIVGLYFWSLIWTLESKI